MDVHPLWNYPLDNAYAPYFEENQTKWAPNLTSVEDLILCKLYVVVSEIPQLEWGRFSKPSLVCLQ